MKIVKDDFVVNINDDVTARLVDGIRMRYTLNPLEAVAFGLMSGIFSASQDKQKNEFEVFFE